MFLARGAAHFAPWVSSVTFPIFFVFFFFFCHARYHSPRVFCRVATGKDEALEEKPRRER